MSLARKSRPQQVLIGSPGKQNHQLKFHHCLGQGGTATVLYATEGPQSYAVKVIHKGYAQSQGCSAEHIKTEREIMSMISQQHLLQKYCVGLVKAWESEDLRYIYFVMVCIHVSYTVSEKKDIDLGIFLSLTAQWTL